MTLDELKSYANTRGWNYRYVAYALSRGYTNLNELFERDGSNAGYFAFISQCSVDAKRAMGWKDSHAPIPIGALDAAIMARMNDP